MALVAYGSDESDIESEPEDTGVVQLMPNNLTKLQQNGRKQDKGESDLFMNLPQPKHAGTDEVVEEQDEFLFKKEIATEKPKKEKVGIKIGIPALDSFESDEEDGEPKNKKLKINSKSSGLFALLPPPKTTPISTKSFIPNVLTKKAHPKPPPRKTAPPKAPISKPTKLPLANNPEESEDEDDVPVEIFDDETWKQVCGRKKKPAKPILEINTPEIEEPVIDAAPEAVEPYSGLDNFAFKKLVGSSKMRPENIKLIDINEEQVISEKDVWMTKALTDPECKPKYVVDDPVNDTCKRKHHITYLAQQAKANEQELQNQWSQSKYSRKQTQAKYGF